MTVILVMRRAGIGEPARSRSSVRRKRHGRTAASALAVCLVAGLMAGCGSSSKNSSTNTTPSSANTPTGSANTPTGGTNSPKGTPIVIGNIGSYKGAEASSISTAQSAIQAWADSVNADGGIGGHPIHLIVKQDNDNPATGLTAAKELINQEHVVALVSDFGDTDPAWNTLFQKAGIPIIGGSQAAPGNPNNPLFFPAETAESALTYAELYGLKVEGATKIAYPYCAEVSQCASGIPFAKAAAPLLGMQIVWFGSFSLSAPDLTPQCLAGKAAGATGVFPSAPLTNDIKFAQACYQQDWKPSYGMGGGQLDSSLLSIPAFNGTISAQGTAPWFENSTPALQEFHAAMAKYAPGVSIHDDSAIVAWASGKLFQAAVAASGSSTVTSASILTGLYSLHNETLGGLAPSLNFTKGKQAQPTCFFLAGIKNGQFVAPAGLKTAACAPAS